MVDITPELLERIQDDFAEAFSEDIRLAELNELIQGGKASYKEADEYAARVGDILADAYRKNISSNVLPNGKMYYNIAERVLNPTLEENYRITADVAEKVQEGLNEAAGIKIKVQRPELNQDRIDGIINLVADAEQYDDVEWEFLSAIINFTQNIVTDSVRRNADFHYESGLSPKIVRTSEAGACKWCRALAGTYDYGGVKDTGNDVWRRHRDCRCVVEYDPGNGAKQNSHTKQWRREEENGKIESRKQVGTEKKKTAGQRNIEYALKNGITSEEICRAIIENHEALKDYAPEKMKELLESFGYDVKPLGSKSSLNGIPFEEGGGYRASFKGDGYIQYHPKKNSHHMVNAEKVPYWRISFGKGGDNRYDMDGRRITEGNK